MADYLITFGPIWHEAPPRDPEVVTADDVHMTDGAVMLTSCRGVEAIYPPCLGVSVRQLPDPPTGSWLSRAARWLR